VKLHVRFFILLCGVSLLWGGTGQAQTASPGQSWTYRLLEGSTFYHNCPVCGPPIILQPMRGTFDLVLLEDTGTLTRYALSNVSFTASNNAAGKPDRLVGEGTYTLRSPGPAKPTTEMTLQTSINDSTNTFVFTIDTNEPVVDRAWPVLQVSLIETQQATFTQVYHMDLLAAPLREIWFSTASGLTASKWQSPTNHVSAGDLLSDTGRVVRSNPKLLSGLGIMPGLPEIGIDAVDIAPGGEILFSLNKDVFSEILGPIQHGDLLSDRGKIVKRNQDLLAAFNLADTNSDYGLDAVQVMTNGEIYFSIATNAVSPGIGGLSIGDVLSDQGRVVKYHFELLANFHPPPSLVDQDYGLDALYVWPGGEIWFSTEQGFQDLQLGPILAGDLLSDQGYIVVRNLELTSAFAPVEDLADFGLDALYIVTDATPPAPAPRIVSIENAAQSGDVTLQWDGLGRTFQLEKAGDVAGPFLPASPIFPDSNWIDSGDAQTNSKAFYRLRHW
jgi:hypothetical protein